MIPVRTLGRFILAEGRKHPQSTGELSDLLTAIALGVKLISPLVATAGFKGLSGYTGKTNIQGEQTFGLDEEADEILVATLASSGHFGLLVSEERDSVVSTHGCHADAHYVVAFDPLDGSSNIGSNIPVGTIFSIYRKKDPSRAAEMDDFLQTGRSLVAAGYAVYGAKTSFVYTCGDGVHGFTLDPQIGEFVLTEERIEMPSRGNTYSANEGNFERWPVPVREYISALKREESPCSLRYVGSLVADFDRTLRKGGIFLYPPDTKSPNGKLRLLYECIPLAFIAEQAGGKAVTMDGNVLDIVPERIHQRCPFVVGSRENVERFQTYLSEPVEE